MLKRIVKKITGGVILTFKQSNCKSVYTQRLALFKLETMSLLE